MVALVSSQGRSGPAEEASVTVRVGVIGAGVMGADHVRILQESVSGAEVVAVSDVDPTRAAAAADLAGAMALTDGHLLIDQSDVDAVVIASPDDTHEDYVLACLAAGKPMLCEKPLATTTAGCRRIVETEAGIGRRLIQLGFMRRFDPGYVEMKRLLDAGDIGAPMMLHCVHRNAGSSPNLTSERVIISSAVHEFDVTRWLLGQEIIAATVHTGRSSSVAPAGAYDLQLVVLETSGGVVVEAEVFVNARYGYDVRSELVGETGTLTLVPPSPVTIRASGAVRQPIAMDWRDRFADAYRIELQSWVDGVVAGEVRGPTAWDGYAATAVADACIESLDRGGRALVAQEERPDFYA